MLKQDNRGFGAGQNLAVAQAKTDYILIINPDAELEPESLRFAVNYALADETDVSCWEFSQAPFEHPKYYDPVNLETSWNSHACVLMKRSAFLKVGGYDTTLFLYGEDVELSYKLRAHGYKLRYLPKARIYHDTSPDPKRREDQMTRSIAANLLLRRRYGRYWDRAVGKVLITKSAFTSNIDQRKSVAKANEIYTELKPSFKPSRRHKTYFPFNGLEYDRRRLGRLTPIKAYKTPQTNQRGHTSPLVSIITRVHKTTDILYDAIACVENQTYSNIEHVIVFDGCDPINDDRIKAVYSNQTGRSEAANKGAKAASGDYLLFLDYDDLIFSDHIEGLVDRLNNKKEAVCAYSYCWEAMTKSRETGTVSYLALQNKMETQFSSQGLAENNFFAIQSVLIKSDAFRHVGGFDTRLEYCEDWDLWQRLLKLGEFTPYKKLTSIYFTPASLKDRILRSWDMARQVQSKK